MFWIFGKRFSPEYRWSTSMSNPHWRSLRRLTMALTFGRDCLIPILPAEQVDHLSYRRLGKELPWIDVVPLNARTHGVVTSLRDVGLRWLINPVLRIAYGLWILPWFLGTWQLVHFIGLAPIGPIDAFVFLGRLLNSTMSAWSFVGALLH